MKKIDKARILYNHIWFSELTEEFVDKIYENRQYIKIINHQNYNPRLIEFITDVSHFGEFDSGGYWEYIEETLRHPKDIWRNCFKIQSNAYVRALTVLTVFNGGGITENELRVAFNRFIQLDKLRNTSNTEKDFNSTAQLATKSFLKRHRMRDEVFYSLFNPSISDFILNEYCKDLEKLDRIYKSLGTLQSLEGLVSLEQEEVISHDYMNSLKDSIFEEALNEDRNYDFLIFASYLVQADEKKKVNIQQLIGRIISEPAPITELSKFLSLLIDYHDSLSLNNYKFLLKVISDRFLYESEIRDLARFITILNVNDEDVLNKLQMSLDNFIWEELNSMKTDLDLSHCMVISYGEEEWDTDVSFDHYCIKSELTAMAESVLDSFELDVFGRLHIQINDIVSDIDIDELINEYIESQVELDSDDFQSQTINMDQDIDDLFERS